MHVERDGPADAPTVMLPRALAVQTAEISQTAEVAQATESAEVAETAER